MKIYFCGSIAGGRKFLPVYKIIVENLKSSGNQVLTEHIIDDHVFEYEDKFSPQQIYERDIHLLNQADVVIAEISNPSLGVGYEICYALHHGLKVLCVYQEGLFVSRMITGNTSPGIKIEEYSNNDELIEIINKFLNQKFK